MTLIEAFAAETGVFGLNLLQHRRLTKAEKCFWVGATIFFSALTARDLVNLTQAYLNVEMITFVISENAQNISFSNPPSVYFKLQRSFLAVRSSNFTTEMVKKFIAQNVTLPDAAKKTLTHLNMFLFDQIGAVEMRIIWNASELDETILTKDENIIKELRDIYNFYRRKNVSVFDVQRITAASLCKEIGVAARFYDAESDVATRIDPCNVDFVNEVGFDGFTLKTSLEPLPFTSWEDRLTIEFDYAPLSQAVFDLKGLFGYFYDYRADSVVEITATKPKTTRVTVRPVAIYMKSEKTRTKCKNMHTFDCAWTCVAKAFVGCAHCSPVSLPVRLALADVPVCPANAFNYSAVLAACFGTNETKYWNVCYDECFVSGSAWCEKRSYSLATEVAGMVNSSTIEVSVASFTYPVFQERPLMDWEMFIAQLGGSIGLYLGLSFAAVLHIPVFCFREVCASIARKANLGVLAAPISVEMIGSSKESDLATAQLKLSQRVDELLARLQTIEKLYMPMMPRNIGYDSGGPSAAK